MPSDGRLFWIRSTWFLDRLHEKKHTTAAQLAEKFCYSIPSARRTINSLKDDFGAPIHFDRKTKTWHLTDPGWSMPKLPLSPDEISAVALVKNLVSKISAPNIAEPMERFWRKLCMNLSQQSPAGAGFAHAVSARAPSWTHIPTHTMETCLRALALNRRLHITYFSPWKINISERTIEPRHLLLYDGAYYLIAHCLLKSGKLRFFNLRAVKSSKITETPCSKTEFKIEDAIDSYGLITGGKKTTVTLRIHPPRGAHAAIETWHPDQQDTLEPDGTLVRSFPVRGLQEVHRLVLSYGDSVEVLKPKSLRDAVNKEILAIAERINAEKDTKTETRAKTRTKTHAAPLKTPERHNKHTAKHKKTTMKQSKTRKNKKSIKNNNNNNNNRPKTKTSIRAEKKNRKINDQKPKKR